jgi:hypothetical protein
MYKIFQAFLNHYTKIYIKLEEVMLKKGGYDTLILRLNKKCENNPF